MIVSIPVARDRMERNGNFSMAGTVILLRLGEVIIYGWMYMYVGMCLIFIVEVILYSYRFGNLLNV